MENASINNHISVSSTSSWNVGFIGFDSFGGAFKHYMEHTQPSVLGSLQIHPLRSTEIEQLSPELLCPDLVALFQKNQLIFVDTSEALLQPLLNRIRLLLSDAHIFVYLGSQHSFESLEAQVNQRKFIRMSYYPCEKLQEASVIYTMSELVESQEVKQFREVFASTAFCLEASDETQFETLQHFAHSSGSLMLICLETLADLLSSKGVSRKEAYGLMQQTLFHSLKQLLHSEMHPSQLKDQILDGLHSSIPSAVSLLNLEQEGLRSLLIKSLGKNLL